MKRDQRLAVVYTGMAVFKKSYNPILAKDRLPDNPDKKVLWFDSTGVLTNEEFASYNQVRDMIGFIFDSWLEMDISIANPF